MTLELEPPSDTGGATLWHYEVYHDNGFGGTLHEKIVGDIELHEPTQNVIPIYVELTHLDLGTVYRVGVRFATIVGWSDMSETVELRCCTL